MLSRIAAEWDRNAVHRCEQLSRGLDFSHDRVLLPLILRLAGDLTGKNIVDAGCGCGFLTAAAARKASSAVGVDVSRQMILQASQRFGGQRNLRFEVRSVERFAKVWDSCFDICLANMSVMVMPRLERALASMRIILRPGGRLVFSIGHPCIWNTFRRDEAVESFDYWRSHPVVAPFRITLDHRALPVPTTYFHRPLSKYVSSLIQAGFEIEAIEEPKAPKDSPPEYIRKFVYPRFVVFSAVAKYKLLNGRSPEIPNGLS